MKTLLVAPLHWHDQWETQNSEELTRYGEIRSPLVIGQGQYFWWKALRQLGHEVEVCRYTDPTPVARLLKSADLIARRIPFPGRRIREQIKRRDTKIRNQRVVTAAQRYKPDVIIVSGGFGTILAETVNILRREMGARLAYTDGTSPVVSAHAEQKKAASYYDCIFTNDHNHSIQWLELGARRSVDLPVSGCDPDYHRRYELTPEERTRFQSDICFVGRLAPVSLYAGRFQALKAFAHLDLGIWTDDDLAVRSDPALAGCYRGHAYGVEMLKVLSAAKIALNLHGRFMQYGGNMRTFEIPATGTFQLIDRYDSSWFIEGEEIVSFNGIQELKTKVNYFLAHDEERERIARQGQIRVHRDHTYEQRMEKILSLLQESERFESTIPS